MPSGEVPLSKAKNLSKVTIKKSVGRLFLIHFLTVCPSVLTWRIENLSPTSPSTAKNAYFCDFT